MVTICERGGEGGGSVAWCDWRASWWRGQLGRRKNGATDREEGGLVESEGAPAADARDDVLWYSA